MRLIVVGMFCSAVFGASYSISPGPNTEFKLQVLKTGLMSGKIHIFTYEKYSGTLDYDEAAPEKSKVAIDIESASVVCRDTWVSDKDKVKITALAHEMMDDTKHPKMTFRSESVTKRADGAFDVKGTLTLKGIAKPVVIKVAVQSEGGALRLKGSTTLLRKDFSIKPPTPPLGVINNKEEMPVDFNLLATKSK